MEGNRCVGGWSVTRRGGRARVEKLAFTLSLRERAGVRESPSPVVPLVLSGVAWIESPSNRDVSSPSPYPHPVPSPRGLAISHKSPSKASKARTTAATSFNPRVRGTLPGGPPEDLPV